MRVALLLAVLTTLFGVGGMAMAAEPIAKISVLSSGNLLLDGKSTTLVALDSALATIKASNGVVWYYRENAAAEPPPVSSKVIELVIKHRLPVSMSTKPDFSDAVGADGRSHPREP